MAPPTLTVVRHGQTDWSLTGRHTGRTDVPLDEIGRLEAEKVGEALGGRNFSQVLSSPLLRAFDTCSIAGFGDRAVRSDDLCEWDYGEQEGRTTDEIRATDPEWSLWTHGVADGETAGDVGRRVDRVIEQVRSGDGDALCFAHGHVLRVLAARWVDLPPVAGRLLALGSGSVGLLGWEREVAVISRWNARPPEFGSSPEHD